MAASFSCAELSTAQPQLVYIKIIFLRFLINSLNLKLLVSLSAVSSSTFDKHIIHACWPQLAVDYVFLTVCFFVLCAFILSDMT